MCVATFDVRFTPNSDTKSGHSRCPLCAISDQSAPQQNSSLFDHFVRGAEQRRRHGEAEHPGGRSVDHQLQLCRLHDGQVCWLNALEDSTGIDAELTDSIRYIDSVTHQPAEFWNIARRISRGYVVAGR